MASISTAHYSLFRPFLLKQYAKIYNADCQEADFKAPNFKDFFTRSRCHPIVLQNGFVSPCDGVLAFKATCEIGDDLGSGINLKEILKCDLKDALYDVYILYLAPGDYHRFHAPNHCKFTKLTHFHGPLKPIAPWYYQYSNKPFSHNERVILSGESENGKIFYSAIGALHVGSIELNQVNLQTNLNNIHKTYDIDPLEYQKGEEIGRFNLGSCLVVAKESKESEKYFENMNRVVRIGETL
eukprot:NODE_177_length_14091_cov_0.996141.p5 type:complete len:240 gc:universal NODE_177_length_14091_cov_0.996141:1-720(+)